MAFGVIIRLQFFPSLVNMGVYSELSIYINAPHLGTTPHSLGTEKLDPMGAFRHGVDTSLQNLPFHMVSIDANHRTGAKKHQGTVAARYQ